MDESKRISLDLPEPQERSRRDFLSLGGALAAGAAAGLTLTGPRRAEAGNEAPPAGALKIALVDIGVVFKKYKRKETLEKEINAKKSKIEDAQKQQEAVLNGLNTKLSEALPNSPLWRERRKEAKLAYKQYEIMRESQSEELSLEVENLTLQILDEIEDRVRKFGNDQKYDLIFKVDSKGWGDERFQERVFRAQVQSVLFHDAKLDVTETILGFLNDPAWIKECEQKKAAQQPQSSPPPGPSAPSPPSGEKKDEKPGAPK